MITTLKLGSLTDIARDVRWNATEIRRRVDSRVRRFGVLGLRRGDRVLVHFGNKPEFFAELLAVWQLGGSVVPVDARLTPREVTGLAAASEARFSVFDDSTNKETLVGLTDVTLVHTDDTAGESIKTALRVEGSKLDDDALILYTSGSTGEPKGVVHTHRSLQARWITLEQSLGTKAFEKTLCLLPTHFGHGLICNCLFPWLYGNDLFIAPPFKTELLASLGSIIDEHRISFLSSVPAMWSVALRMADPPKGGTLTRAHIGSAPLGADVWRNVQRWCGTDSVCNSYGITETGSWVAGMVTGVANPEDGLIGVPWGGRIAVLKATSIEELMQDSTELPAGEPGMIWLTTPALMREYFNRKELTDSVVHNGWFLTGDLGHIDDRNLLYIHGRARDEINKGGTKISPAAIDLLVQQFGAVRDVCTFAMDDPLYGENVGLALALSNDDPETVAALYGWVTKNLAEYKWPARWYLLDQIPRTSRGKVNRAQVRDHCANVKPLNLRQILGRAQEKK